MFKCIQNLRQIVHAGLGYYNAIKVYFDRNMIKIVQLHVVLANNTSDQAVAMIEIGVGGGHLSLDMPGNKTQS